MVGTGRVVVGDARGDCVNVTPGDEGVDQTVVKVGDLPVVEALPTKARLVKGKLAHEAQDAAGDLPSLLGVGLDDAELLDRQRGTVAQALPGPGDVLGGDEHRKRTGRSVAGEVQ